ncbi:translation initiation factor IF-2-like [Mesocricetus auratus]|uniref:Translation initiation factor IF-2-like n=1 Tax=Mesocricetus auratus TaxID=10036 RepID=A0ABM2WSD4_MESAU|nr:translation initiation factor IF-2-like [Mesocricetus auratus]
MEQSERVFSRSHRWTTAADVARTAPPRSHATGTRSPGPARPHRGSPRLAAGLLGLQPRGSQSQARPSSRASPGSPHRTGAIHAPLQARQSPGRSRSRIRIRLQSQPHPLLHPRAAAGTAGPNVAGPTPPPCPALTHRLRTRRPSHAHRSGARGAGLRGSRGGAPGSPRRLWRVVPGPGRGLRHQFTFQVCPLLVAPLSLSLLI